jgi:hypothetical protein
MYPAGKNPNSFDELIIPKSCHYFFSFDIVIQNRFNSI